MITHTLHNSIKILCEVTKNGIDVYNFVYKKRLRIYDVQINIVGALHALRDIGIRH